SGRPQCCRRAPLERAVRAGRHPIRWPFCHVLLGRLPGATPVHLMSGVGIVSLQRQAAVALAILACALLAKNATGALIQSRADDAVARAQAAQQMETHEKQFAIGLLNQETGERGFELTGQSAYLQPYELGLSQANAARQFLNTASADSSTRAKLVAMENAAGYWQAFADSRLATVEASGPAGDPASDLVGKALFDAFRSTESDLSSSLEAAVKQDLASAQSLAAGGSAASVVGT